jgi:hypothetical protein
VGLLHSTGRVGASGRWRWNHEPQTLQQQDRALGGSPPYKLATFTLAVLHVDVAAGVLQAAILERAIYEYTLIQNQVLILEDLVFMSIHGSLALQASRWMLRFGPTAPAGVVSLEPVSNPGSNHEAIIRLRRAQAGEAEGSVLNMCWSHEGIIGSEGGKNKNAFYSPYSGGVE